MEQELQNYCTTQSKCTANDVFQCKFFSPPVFIEIIQPCVFLSNDGGRCLCATALIEVLNGEN